jgi:preprotein translocase subunit YajC
MNKAFTLILVLVIIILIGYFLTKNQETKKISEGIAKTAIA